MLRLLRLAKMLRLGRLKRIMERYSEELQPYVKMMKLSGMLLVASFLGHILASFWFFVGQLRRGYFVIMPPHFRLYEESL